MKVLIISLSNLGDAILTYPAIQSLWNTYPQAQFHVVVSARTKELFAGDSRFARIWVWEKSVPFWNKAAVVLQLFAARFDLVVDFRHSIISILLCAKRTPLVRPSPQAMHRAQTHLELLRSLKIPISDVPVKLPFGSVEEAQVSRWLEPGRPCIVISPGSRSHLKRWREDRFAEVADRLAVEHQAQIVLVGSAEEMPIAEKVHSLMKQPALNVAGQTTVRQLFALLSKARLCVTNDSACLHAADAMGIPTLAIFGPSDEKKYGPRGFHSAVARKNLVCAPCELALCPYGHECMRRLETAEVYDAAVKMLNGSNP